MCDGAPQNIFGLGPHKAIIRPCPSRRTHDEYSHINVCDHYDHRSRIQYLLV